MPPETAQKVVKMFEDDLHEWMMMKEGRLSGRGLISGLISG